MENISFRLALLPWSVVGTLFSVAAIVHYSGIL